MSPDLFEQFAAGRLVTEADAWSAVEHPWKAHPTYSGVMLKDLIPAEGSGGLYSFHLVRIEPGMEIGLHTHPEHVEVHAVLEGSGRCRFTGEAHPYEPGTLARIPAGVEHEVLADAGGLRLMAIFVRTGS